MTILHFILKMILTDIQAGEINRELAILKAELQQLEDPI